MAARPTWKGHLKLSLVSCPIVLYPATSSSERTAFRQINLKTRNRLRQQLIDDQTKEVVEAADKGRGLEIAKNVYLPVTDEEIDSVAIESSHTVSIERFVRHDTIDDRYHDTPYYVAPDEDGDQETFSVIHEAMRGKGVVALARIVLNKRERIVMIQPWEDGLLATTLHYAYEVRAARTVFAGIVPIKIDPEMRELAERLIEQRAGKFEPETFTDRYEEALVAMLDKKRAGAPIPKDRPSAPTSGKVVNLMEALRNSTKGEGPTTRRKAPPLQPKAPARRPAATRRKATSR